MTPDDLDRLELRDLLRLSGPELDDLYRSAATPATGELDGEYDGVLIEGELPKLHARFPIGIVNQPWLPWKGKVFFSGTTGKNRFQVGRVKRRIWKFATRPAPSMFGGTDACYVDYDVAGNSKLLRKTVFDEVKKLKDDLYLGKGGIRVFGTRHFVFYWAIAR